MMFANKSDMAEEEYDNDDMLHMDMSAAIGNPDISRIMGQDMRGMHHLVTDDQ